MKKFISAIAIVLVIALAAVTFVACSLPKSQSKQLIAKWSDSNNLSGYEFKEDGTVEITYVNFTIPILNQKFNGSITGVYSTNKADDVNTVTLTYTILTKSITKTYNYVVNGSSLTMTDPDSGESLVYIKQAAVAPQSSAAA